MLSYSRNAGNEFEQMNAARSIGFRLVVIELKLVHFDGAVGPGELVLFRRV